MTPTMISFRALVAVSYVAYLASVWFWLIPHHSYSEAMYSLAQETGTGSLIKWNDKAWVAVELLYLGITIGLLAGYRKALYLYTVWVCVILFLMPVSGVSVYLPFEGYFGALSWLLTGAALALAYGTKLREQFR